jgi:hypothetical protein
LLAGTEQFRDDNLVVWKPNQIFEKSDRKGDLSRERSPFRFVPHHAAMQGVITILHSFLRRDSRPEPEVSCTASPSTLI